MASWDRTSILKWIVFFMVLDCALTVFVKTERTELLPINERK